MCGFRNLACHARYPPPGGVYVAVPTPLCTRHGSSGLSATDRPLGNSAGATGNGLPKTSIWQVSGPAGRSGFFLEIGSALPVYITFSPPSGLRGGGFRYPPRRSRRLAVLRGGILSTECYLVDSASSHMLVSKIKPCMSKYKQSIR